MVVVKHSILVVDDEPGQRQFLRAALERDHSVVAVADGSEAQQLLKHRNFDLVITDQRMPGMTGIELLSWIKETAPETIVIVLTAYGSVETAVEAMKIGAQDYLSKPLKSPEELRLAVSRSLEAKRLQDKALLHEEEKEQEFPPDIVAESRSMKQVLGLAARVADQPTTVLLTGESGTGKEVVARFIHRKGDRSAGPFVAVNSAALTETLLESELFGHEKGSFTGASATRRGRFELAHGGILFLDEIGEMGIKVQAKLLRVLQEQTFERVGGSRTISVDVRVVAATNRNLKLALEERSFREDLYYRLNVFPIEIPPLRDRIADIIPLAVHFVQKISSRMGSPMKRLSPELEAMLIKYAWPGNIRELQNAVERALIISQEEVLSPEDFPLLPLISTADGQGRAPETLAQVEKEAILKSLSRNGGDRRQTANELGISLRTLQYRLKEYGLVPERTGLEK